MSEHEQYITLNEAAASLGIKRSSLYFYLKPLKIETRKFQLGRERYITQSDVERIQAARKDHTLSGEKR